MAVAGPARRPLPRRAGAPGRWRGARGPTLGAFGLNTGTADAHNLAPELPSTEDVDLVIDGAPGSRLPHAWVERDGRRLSTLDLVRSGFALLTGAGGDRWIQAAQEVADRLGVRLGAYQIAPAAGVTDQERRWPHCAGLAEDGAVLVRPDQFVAWRAATMPDHPAADLTGALTRCWPAKPYESADEVSSDSAATRQRVTVLPSPRCW